MVDAVLFLISYKLHFWVSDRDVVNHYGYA
jgi:hypothetical protein